jgi:hypothetical protein
MISGNANMNLPSSIINTTEGLTHFWSAVVLGRKDVLVEYICRGTLSFVQWSGRIVKLPDRQVSLDEAYEMVSRVMRDRTAVRKEVYTRWSTIIRRCVDGMSRGELSLPEEFMASVISFAFRSSTHVRKPVSFDPGSRAFFGVSHTRMPDISKLHNVVFALLSSCQQNVFHYHFVLVFSYPKSIRTLADELGYKDDATIESIYSSMERVIDYISKQVLDVRMYVAPGWENQLSYISFFNQMGGMKPGSEHIKVSQYDLPYQGNYNPSLMNKIVQPARWPPDSFYYFRCNSRESAMFGARILSSLYFNGPSDILLYQVDTPRFVVSSYHYQPIVVLDSPHLTEFPLLSPYPPFVILVNPSFEYSFGKEVDVGEWMRLQVGQMEMVEVDRGVTQALHDRIFI